MVKYSEQIGAASLRRMYSDITDILSPTGTIFYPLHHAASCSHETGGSPNPGYPASISERDGSDQWSKCH